MNQQESLINEPSIINRNGNSHNNAKQQNLDANNIQIDDDDDNNNNSNKNKNKSSIKAGVLINNKVISSNKIGNLSSTSSSSSDIQRMNDEEIDNDEDNSSKLINECQKTIAAAKNDDSDTIDHESNDDQLNNKPEQICINSENEAEEDVTVNCLNHKKTNDHDDNDNNYDDDDDDDADDVENDTHVDKMQHNQQKETKLLSRDSSFKKKLLTKSQEMIEIDENENGNNPKVSSNNNQNTISRENYKKIKHHDSKKISNGLLDAAKNLNASVSSSTTTSTSSVSSDSTSSSSSSAISSGQSSPILTNDSHSAAAAVNAAVAAQQQKSHQQQQSSSTTSTASINNHQVLSSTTKEQVKKLVTNNIINNSSGNINAKPILNQLQHQQQQHQQFRPEDLNNLISQALFNQSNFLPNYNQFPFHLQQSISAPKLHETKKINMGSTHRLGGLNETMSTTHTYVPPSSSNMVSSEVKAKLKNVILQKLERDKGNNPLAHSLNKSAAHILDKHSLEQQMRLNLNNRLNEQQLISPYQRNDFSLGVYDQHNSIQNQIINKSLIEDENSLRRTTSEPNLKVKSALKATLLEKRNQAHPFNSTKRDRNNSNNGSSGFQIPNSNQAPSSSTSSSLSSKLFNNYRPPFTNNINQFAPKFQPTSLSSFKPISENENFDFQRFCTDNKMSELMASPEFRTLLTTLAQNNSNNSLQSFQALLQVKLQQQQQNEQENNSEMAVDNYDSKPENNLAKNLQQQSPNAAIAAAALLGLSQQTDINNNSNNNNNNNNNSNRLSTLNELETNLQNLIAQQQQQTQQANLLATLQQLALQQQSSLQQKSQQQNLIEYLASAYAEANKADDSKLSADFTARSQANNLLNHQALMQQYSDLFLYNTNRNRLNQNDCLMNPKIAASMSYPNLPINGLINFNTGSSGHLHPSKVSNIPKFGHMAHVEEDNELLLANELKNAAKLNDATQSSMIYESTAASNPILLALQQQQQQQLNGSRSLLSSNDDATATSALQSLQSLQQSGFNFLNNPNLTQLQQQQQLELIRQELIEQKKRQQFQKSSFFSDPYLLKTLETTCISTPNKTDETFTFPSTSTKLSDLNTAARNHQQSMFATNLLSSNKNFLSNLASSSSSSTSSTPFLADNKKTSLSNSPSLSNTFTKNSPSNLSMECSLNQADDKNYRYTTGNHNLNYHQQNHQQQQSQKPNNNKLLRRS